MWPEDMKPIYIPDNSTWKWLCCSKPLSALSFVFFKKNLYEFVIKNIIVWCPNLHLFYTNKIEHLL